MVIPCDMILLKGSVIVDESAVTGLATLPMRVPYTPGTDISDLSRNTLEHGTRIVRLVPGEKIYAVVTRTGYRSKLGEQITSVLLSKTTELPYEKEAFLYIFIFFICALVGAIYTLVQSSELKSLTISSALFLLTPVAPALAPAVLVLPVFVGKLRLSRKNIYSSMPRRLAVFGTVDCVAFDKTGTLTDHGFNLSSLHAVRSDEAGKLQFAEATGSNFSSSANPILLPVGDLPRFEVWRDPGGRSNGRGTVLSVGVPVFLGPRCCTGSDSWWLSISARSARGLACLYSHGCPDCPWNSICPRSIAVLPIPIRPQMPER